MQDSSVFLILLPLALVIIMLGLGLSLTVQDFRNVLQGAQGGDRGADLARRSCCRPSVSASSTCFGLEPVLAVGMMLLAASPGGTSSNLYSHLADGDVALNITLTAINSALAIVTLPLIVNLSLTHFYGRRSGHTAAVRQDGAGLRDRARADADRHVAAAAVSRSCRPHGEAGQDTVDAVPAGRGDLCLGTGVGNAEDLGAGRRARRADLQSHQPGRRLSRAARLQASARARR